MNRTKYLKGPCQQCGSNIEYPAELIGTTINCPHCGQSTELQLARPPVQPTVPRRVILWTAAAALILVLGFLGSIIALKRVERLAARARQTASASAPASKPAPALPQQTNSTAGPTTAETAPTTEQTNPPADASESNSLPAFQVSAVRLEKAEGTSLVYAKGSVTNPLDRQRFGVRIELDVFDAAGQKIGTTKDYTQLIEPKAKWDFKALVVQSKAASAKVASLKEQD